MPPLLTITICLLVAFIFAEFAHFNKYPRVIGHLIAGLVLGIPIIEKNLFPATTLPVIEVLSQLGVIFLLLLTGMELNVKKFKSVERDSILLGLGSMTTSFLSGFLLGHLLGLDTLPNIVIGSCMAITAEGTNANVLMDLHKLNSRFGNTLMGAGILDDILEILFLAIVIAFADGFTSAKLIQLPLQLLGFAIVVWLAVKFIPRMIYSIEKEHSSTSLFTSTLLVTLTFAAISEYVELGALIGAFIAGILLQFSFKKHVDEQKDLESIRLITLGLAIPFFFINIGIHFDYKIFLTQPGLVLAFFSIGIIGKILGSIMVTPWVNFTLKQTYLMGWGLNSRGVVELVIAQLALTNGFITADIYSAIVVMAISSTLLFPIILTRAIRRSPSITD